MSMGAAVLGLEPGDLGDRVAGDQAVWRHAVLCGPGQLVRDQALSTPPRTGPGFGPPKDLVAH
jgi:hypothetical protein